MPQSLKLKSKLEKCMFFQDFQYFLHDFQDFQGGGHPGEFSGKYELSAEHSFDNPLHLITCSRVESLKIKV